mmetsp:Transcript_159909/g.298261  ORF Transcript_159909/g.298261 Transcript_159909/m.298261 type:complete len:391 (+) Transcript_159909:93-1265(+)
MILRLVVQMTIPYAVAGKSWSPEDLPNPSKQPSACGQKFPSRICDPEGYLGAAEGVHAALRVLETEYEYPGCGSYEMAIVIVGKILGGGTDEVTQKFARDVMDKWGVGKAACNNGIVLVLAVRDRKMFIATGRGAREHLPDEELQAVLDRMKPLLKGSQYSDAVEQCISDVARILSGESFGPAPWQRFLGMVPWHFVLVFGLLCGCKWRDNRKRRRYEACRRKLSQIEHERAQAKASQYQAESCAICLELFAESQQEQELLACGHVFHKLCIDSWDGNTCPICRASLSDATARPRVSTETRLLSTFDDEYAFRLSRVRYQYPDLVTDDMLTRWSAPHHSGQLVADTAFIRQSPAYQAARSSSAGGSSSTGGNHDFGGGCSSGGGGAGGGW